MLPEKKSIQCLKMTKCLGILYSLSDNSYEQKKGTTYHSLFIICIKKSVTIVCFLYKKVMPHPTS